jgi:hypothetical protein
MRTTISFLIGSGFSIPDGLPGVRELNQRLSKIDESEILIHTDQTTLFLKGQNDPNRWCNIDERFFLQEFLEFYNSEILKDNETFHYETFYDFYSGYIYNNENTKEIESFNKKFNERHDNKLYERDCFNRILDFNRSFNQLLASLLHKSKYFENVSYANYPRYENFVGFLKELIINNDIKIHTLNHDLLFEFLGHNHSSLWENFTDGFQLVGSPFYGILSHEFNPNTVNKVYKEYLVKLEQFTNKFDKPISLYKLHGSIFNTIVYTKQPEQKRIRLKGNYAISGIKMEVQDTKTGEYQFVDLYDETAPDFLSGTTNKTRFYTKDPYYINLFKHFENNLLTSDKLIVIGYGFQDIGINEYLEKFFLSKGKQMIIIDPFKPKTHFIEKYNATYIQKGITEVSYMEFLEQIPLELKSKSE